MTTRIERFPTRTELTKKLVSKKYRYVFTDDRIRRGLPLQIRAIREARGWNQKQLGDAAGIPQANVSRIENTREKFLSFQTLLRIAEAFDMALVVKFAPFSELEELATRPLAELVPLDFRSEQAERQQWESAQTDNRPDNLAMHTYWRQLVKRPAPQVPLMKEERCESTSSPQGGVALLRSTGANKPLPEGGRTGLSGANR
jgi:transcriptional regulator with XRE-family HTH domain